MASEYLPTYLSTYVCMYIYTDVRVVVCEGMNELRVQVCMYSAEVRGRLTPMDLLTLPPPQAPFLAPRSQRHIVGLRMFHPNYTRVFLE